MLRFGILNITPDSFSDGGRFSQKESAFRRFDELMTLGCDYVDIGGASSRPGSLPVAAAEEWDRIGPILEHLHKQKKTHLVSVDTFQPEIIQKCLSLGVGYINSIQGCLDQAVMKDIASTKTGFIAMHMHGDPERMQASPLAASEALLQVEHFLKESKQVLLTAGFPEDKFFLDPGIGFGKSFAANEALLLKAKEWGDTFPLFYGISRKGFIRKKFNLDFGRDLDSVCRGIEYMLEISGVKAVRVHLAENE